MSWSYCLMNNCDDSTHLSGIIGRIARSSDLDNTDKDNIGTEKTKNFALSALPFMQRMIMDTPENESRLRGYEMFGNDAEVYL